MFTVTFYGLDNSENFKDCQNLSQAQYEAASLSENGCHSISITDGDGVDYEY